MTTRTYYIPKNRIGVHLINYMITKVGCSIGDIRTSTRAVDVLKVPVTCNDCDVKKIENILTRYGMMEDE